jgi:hypothetical protein
MTDIEQQIREFANKPDQGAMAENCKTGLEAVLNKESFVSKTESRMVMRILINIQKRKPKTKDSGIRALRLEAFLATKVRAKTPRLIT